MELTSTSDVQLNNAPQLTMKGMPMAKDSEVTIQSLPINKIKLARNSRMSVSTEELDGLMQSIKQVGLLQPIGVVKSGNGYEVCYGNRRFMAVSKLGISRIPVIVHANKKAFDGDIKNLTENIQRRNLGLAEVGRYMEILKKEGLANGEIAVRLGVTKDYVKHCLDSFARVPEKYRDAIEIRLTPDQKSGKTTPGKIAVRTATAIISAQKTYRLDKKQTERIFDAAKSGDGFKVKQMKEYAAAVKQGKDPLKAVKPVKQILVNFFMEQDEYEKLRVKYIDDGPFNSITALMLAILEGKVAQRVKVINR